MKKFNRKNVLSWWTIPANMKCDHCGEEQAEHIMQMNTFFYNRIFCLCTKCRVKWINGEINL